MLYVRAADDYCEAVLADGRVLLVTMTLARLLDALRRASFASTRAMPSTAPT
jgi:DNA-binding LytR/AlgR family response regulator